MAAMAANLKIGTSLIILKFHVLRNEFDFWKSIESLILRVS